MSKINRKISLIITNTHQAFKFMILLAQFFAMFPVCGISGPDCKSLKFKWTCGRTIYSIVYMFLLLLNVALYVDKILTSTLKFGYFGRKNLIFLHK